MTEKEKMAKRLAKRKLALKLYNDATLLGLKLMSCEEHDDKNVNQYSNGDDVVEIIFWKSDEKLGSIDMECKSDEMLQKAPGFEAKGWSVVAAIV